MLRWLKWLFPRDADLNVPPDEPVVAAPEPVVPEKKPRTPAPKRTTAKRSTAKRSTSSRTAAAPKKSSDARKR